MGIVLVFVGILGVNRLYLKSDSLTENLKYARVQEAYTKHHANIDVQLALLGLVNGQGERKPFDLYLRGFKHEGQLEVWVKDKSATQFIHFRTYPFCATSGDLGPKWKQGDRQIPEGLYRISLFNPQSSFHLSLRLNYPNGADSIRSRAADLGGDIYIHGGCETIGCIPITDKRIEELYVLALLAKESEEVEIPVHIFPARMNHANRAYLRTNETYDRAVLQQFWDDLAPIYQYFETTGKYPNFNINNAGRYVLLEER